MRQARRQKRLPNIAVPEICILDPDGDIVRNLRTTERASRHEGWACYHTELYVFRRDGHDYGIVGCAVGAAFAVLIAEELFASGCRLLLSITSAGQIAPLQAPPYFVVIDRALRDEGTSYHYLPASEYSEADVRLTELAREALSTAGMSVRVGASWTTDAPFRETKEAITAALRAGILAVEMEAAALYAFAKARASIRCLLCPRDQSNGADRGRFRKRYVGGRRGIAPRHFPDGRSVARSERLLNVEAVTRANMRFVPTKTTEQQSGLVLHCTRHLLIRQQTSVINAIR